MSTNSPVRLTQFQILILWGAAFILWGVYCHSIFRSCLASNLPDFQAYKAATLAFLDNTQVYGKKFTISDTPLAFHSGLRFYYPPTFLLFLRPFLEFSPPTAIVLYTAINLITLLFLAYLLTVMFRGYATRPLEQPPLLFLSTLFAVAFFPPVWNGLSYGQVHLLVAFLITLFLHLYTTRNDFFTGIALAVTVHIKFIPILLVLLPLFARRGKILTSFALSFVLILFCGLLLNTPFSYWEQFVSAMASFPQPEPEANNHAFASVLSESFEAPYALTKWVLFFTLGGLFSILLYRATKTPSPSPKAHLFFLGTLLLLPPLYWIHYATWLLPIIFFLFFRRQGSFPYLLGLYAFFYFIDPAIFFSSLFHQDWLTPILRLSTGLTTLALSIAAFRAECNDTAPHSHEKGA